MQEERLGEKRSWENADQTRSFTTVGGSPRSAARLRAGHEQAGRDKSFHRKKTLEVKSTGKHKSWGWLGSFAGGQILRNKGVQGGQSEKRGWGGIGTIPNRRHSIPGGHPWLGGQYECKNAGYFRG